MADGTHCTSLRTGLAVTRETGRVLQPGGSPVFGVKRKVFDGIRCRIGIILCYFVAGAALQLFFFKVAVTINLFDRPGMGGVRKFDTARLWCRGFLCTLPSLAMKVFASANTSDVRRCKIR